MTAALRSLRPSSSPPGFAPPYFSGPVDVSDWLRLVPAHATGKGMFLARLLGELDRRGVARPTSERFLPFSDYPMRRCLELNAECARLLYPQLPAREALRRVAWLSFDTFANSLIGQVLFGAVGHDVSSILRLASRALAYATNVGEFQAEIIDSQSAMVHAAESYLFLEPFGAGMLEGVLRACGKDGEVLACMSSPTEGSFYMSWRERHSG